MKERSEIKQRLSHEQFDLLVIGGGITGAGIALDAALRGLKIALVEKNDFAWGTSSRSTKLIHGGLRYLKQLEFGLVKEVGSERAVVHRLAPHLVVPEKMLLPLYDKRGFGSTLTSVGLKLYDWLAGVKREDQRRMLTRKQTLSQEPLLRKEDVKGGAIYAEYRTDDARLTIEIMKTAADRGALVLNYSRVTQLVYTDKKITGVEILDELNGESYSVSAAVVVSAAGPWVDLLRELDHSKKGKRLHLTKGVHLVFSHQRLPVKQAIYFDVEDGRMIFAIPRGRTTYVGTTDTNYAGEIDRVEASREDETYLIKAVNRTFPEAGITSADVESSWAGLRPLIHEEGKSASELSRKDELFESPSGLISIAGGKLTGYRKMAERVVDLVIEKAFPDRELHPCQTDETPLTASGFADYEAVKAFQIAFAVRAKQHGLSEELAPYLVGNYGRQADTILTSMGSGDAAEALIRAEATYTLRQEMVMKPLDFFVRRTGMLYFYKSRMASSLGPVLEVFRTHFNWTDAQVSIEKKLLELTILDATKFD